MNIDDILNKKPGAASMAKVSIEGLGDDVEVYQLSTAERLQLDEDYTAMINSRFSDTEMFEKWIWRLLVGPSRKSTKKELEKLKALLNDSIESEIYRYARMFPIDNAIKK